MNTFRSTNNTCGGGKRKTQKRKTQKRKTQKRKTTRGGSCGCEKTQGGKRKIKGGSANLQAVPIRYLYQYKNEAMNPQDPHTVGSGRLMGDPSKLTLGGKSKKRFNRSKRVRGGALDLLGTSMNPITSFWTSAGLPNAIGTLSASPYVDKSIHVQPVETNYGGHNPPLV
jgi:hypothetical protein